MKNLISKLNEDGYIVVKKLFSSRTILKLKKSYEKSLDYCLRLKDYNYRSLNLDQKYLFLEKVNPNLKSRSYDISKFHPSMYHEVLKNKKFLKILKEILSEEYFIDYPQIRADDMSNSRMLPMHQELYGQLSHNLITLWLPLTDVSKKNGTICIIKKSHTLGPLKHRFYYLNGSPYHGVEKKFIKNKNFSYLNIKAGDAVLFGPNLIHGTSKNNSNKIRWTYVARFNGISGISYLKNKKSSLRISQSN